MIHAHAPRERVGVKIAVALFLCAASVWIVHLWLTERGLAHPPVSVALAFCFVQSLGIGAVGAVSITLKLMRQVREIRSNRLQPIVHAKIARHVAGAEHTQWFRDWWRNCPEDIEAGVLECLGSVSGDRRQRLRELTEGIGLANYWRQKSHSRNAADRREALANLAVLGGEQAEPALVAALNDVEESVRLEGARGLIRLGHLTAIGRVFEIACHETLLVQVVLVEDLRPYALELAANEIPAELASRDDLRVHFALEAARAWRCLLPAHMLLPLLQHARAEIRAAALALLPAGDVSPEETQMVFKALTDPDERVAAAASEAIVRLDCAGGLETLAAQLSESSGDRCLAHARAISQLGAAGMRILEQQIVFGEPDAAAASLEALEKVKLDRLLPQ